MPLFVPIIAGAVIAGLTAKGVKDAYEGSRLIKKAKDMVEQAKREYEKEYNKTALLIDDFVSNILSPVGERKLQANELRISAARTIFKAIKKLKIRDLRVEEIKQLSIIEDEVSKELPKLVESFDMLKGFVKAGGASYLAYLGATGIATNIGVASTGTAISALSGAAAQNALLAWFGGGALAAGGGGIALGSAVLSGLVFAPAVAVAGFTFKKGGEKAYTKAKSTTARLFAEKKKLSIMQKNIHYSSEKLQIYDEVLAYLTEKVQKHNKKLTRRLKSVSILPAFTIRKFIETELTKLFLLVKYGLTPMIETQLISNKDFAFTHEAEKLIEDMHFIIDSIEQGNMCIEQK